MIRIHLATALVRRAGAILLVASRYPNQPEPLWNMPGGRQAPGELLGHTVLRELQEETGLTGELGELCYVSESFDREVHFTNFTFIVHAQGDLLEPVPGDHVVGSEWTPLVLLAQRMSVAVVREPLLAYLNGTLPRYAGYPQAGIAIDFPG